MDTHELKSFYEARETTAAVNWKTFKTRVVSLDWEKERAVTTPLGKYKKTVESNHTGGERRKKKTHDTGVDFYESHPDPAVSYHTFYQRFRCGMDQEKAISLPLQNRHQVSLSHEVFLYWKKNRARAKTTLRGMYARVKSGGCSMEAALTSPDMRNNGETLSDLSRCYRENLGNTAVTLPTAVRRVNRLGWETQPAIMTPGHIKTLPV